ncbi:ralA-binding protein 1-like [Watersipora subatra]|uniref:ralA-binding protein 1-like n=1 Tax=Watersipora subatra TaxID=2589382 RepID=UPI00355C9994
MSDKEKGYSGSDNESMKPPLLTKKKKKLDKPGYKMFDAEGSDDEAVLYDDAAKAPVAKLKKHSRPSFKFTGKIKLKDKEEKGSTLDRKDEKESRRQQSKKVKENKEPKLHKKKDKSQYSFGRKNIHSSGPAQAPVEAVNPVFGVPLVVAVERTPSYDGVQLPIVVRECIDYIEEHGLLYEGIYRISGVKSKVQMLKDAYNRQAPAYLYEHDPSIVASLLKQFIRELPETILTNQHTPQFEEASVVQTEWERVERLRVCINKLPSCNKELLSWMIVHMNHIIAKEKINKMGLQNVSIVLSPTMRISHRVLNVLFLHSKQLFSDVTITRYRPPLQPAASKWSVDLPEDVSAVEGELYKQEALLNILHNELHGERLSASTRNAEKEELVWEVQRNVTQLKRKLKLIAKTKAARQQEQQLSTDSVKRADPIRRSINAAELNFALQTGSLRRNNKSSQVELASSPASVSTSTEALASQRLGEMGGKASRLSHRTSTSSEANKPHDEINAGESNKPCPDTSLPSSLQETVDIDTAQPSQVNEDVVLQEADESQPAVEKVVEGIESLSIQCAEVKESAAEQEDVKVSSSQDSDRTFPPCHPVDKGTEQIISLSEQSASDQKQPVSEDVPAFTPSPDPTDLLDQERSEHSEMGEGADALSKVLIEQPIDLSNQSQAEQKQPTQSEVKADDAILLIPEKLHAADVNQLESIIEGNDVYNIAEDDELRLLIAEEAQLIWEEEELIAIKDELKQKIDTEVIEIDRLHEEIAEYEELRSITTLGHSSEAMSSDDEYYTSTSDTDPEDEDVALTELDNLVSELYAITEQNNRLEAENAETVKKIHEERMGCVNVKIQIRLLQQQMLSNQAEEQSLI